MIARKSLSPLLLASLVIGLVASQGQDPINTDGCVLNYDSEADYFPSKTTVDDAALFKVEYKGHYKVVTNTAPSVNQTYVLTQCGAPVPESSLFPENAVFVKIPVSKVASLTTTSVAFIEMLGKRSTIMAIDTGSLVSSPCVQYDLQNNHTIRVDDRNATRRDEQLADVDIIFGYSTEPGTENKTVITSEVSDPGPLNRAEWLEFYSTFFNLEEFAQSLTGTINNNYNCFKARVAGKLIKPTIAWTSYVGPNQFNNNTASWSISSAEYKQILSTDAGATFFNGTTNNTFSAVEEFKAVLKDVDIIIDETMVGGSDMVSFLHNYNLTLDDDFKFLKNLAVYREDGSVNPNDGRDWFSSAVAMGDAVLQDVIRVVHPDALPADVHYNWIRNIAKPETQDVLTADHCIAPESNVPTLDRALNCTLFSAIGDRQIENKENNAATSNVVYNSLAAIALCILSVAISL
ncbi:hypothetical protein BGZ76_002276 [Entomortierella beljakovae]|nr:hypothetical protein BGZ76_002276 [Entomortierella beljakovae]